MSVPEELKSKKYYSITLKGRARNGEGRTKAMTFEITKDMAESLVNHVNEQKKIDPSFNKSVAIRKGIALYLSMVGAGKRPAGSTKTTWKPPKTEKDWIKKITQTVDGAYRRLNVKREKSIPELLGKDYPEVIDHLKSTWFVEYGEEYTGQQFQMDHRVSVKTAKDIPERKDRIAYADELNKWYNLGLLTPADNLAKRAREKYMEYEETRAHVTKIKGESTKK